MELAGLFSAPLQCVVDDDAVTSWLHVHRLPFFWSSPLLYQYTLCLQLTAGPTTNLHNIHLDRHQSIFSLHLQAMVMLVLC